MSKIIELREKREKLWKTATAFLEEKRDENGFVSAEDTETYEKMEADVVNLGHEIKRLERQAKIDMELSMPTSTPIRNTPANVVEVEKKGRASEEYKRAFWNAMRSRNPYNVQNALQIGDDQEGGYLVPDEYDRTLIDKLEEENVFRQIAHIIKTSYGDRKIVFVSDKGEAVWLDEEALMIESDDKFGQLSLGAHKVGTIIKVSDELINDNVFNLEDYIAREFARRVARKEEQAFFIGDGVNKPTGIFNATGGAEIGLTAGTSIKADDLIDLYHSLDKTYREKAVFVMNDSTVKAIRKLKDTTGQYLWQPSIQAGQPDTILNRPLKTSSFVPEIQANAKAIAFGNFEYYYIADRQGRTFQRLNELFAQTGQIGFRTVQRLDGKLIRPDAIKVLQMGA